MIHPETMFGVVLTGHGGPDMLEFRNDLPFPQPATGDVVIKVAAAAVNNTDINTRLAWYSKDDGNAADAGWSGTALRFPLVQGADICGDIIAVGKGVDAARIGERVIVEPCLQKANGQTLQTPWYIGSECNGGFAQFTKVAAQHAYAIKSGLSDIELASFPCSYSTAENLLTRSNVKAGDHVLVTGASGGVGSAAVQLLRARGATVSAVTSPTKEAALYKLGVERVIHRGASLITALGSDTVDVVIDLVAGKAWPELLEVLRPGGRYAVSGAIGGPIVELDIRTLYLKDLSFFGCTVLDPQVFGNLVSLIESGSIVPLVAKVFPLSEINRAQDCFGSKKHTGKIVLQIS